MHDNSIFATSYIHVKKKRKGDTWQWIGNISLVPVDLDL